MVGGIMFTREELNVILRILLNADIKGQDAGVIASLITKVDRLARTQKAVKLPKRLDKKK
jgi:hypothetical protein